MITHRNAEEHVVIIVGVIVPKGYGTFVLDNLKNGARLVEHKYIVNESL